MVCTGCWNEYEPEEGAEDCPNCFPLPAGHVLPTESFADWSRRILSGQAPVADDGAPLIPMSELPTVEVRTPTEDEMVERMERRRAVSR